MDSKKDPGKFTIRFNMADPQQREVAGLLNQQGRFKAQFLANAVLHYIHCSKVVDAWAKPSGDSAAIERIVLDILAQQQTAPSQAEHEPDQNSSADWESPLEADEKASIWRTMEAFQSK